MDEGKSSPVVSESQPRNSGSGQNNVLQPILSSSRGTKRQRRTEDTDASFLNQDSILYKYF